MENFGVLPRPLDANFFGNRPTKLFCCRRAAIWTPTVSLKSTCSPRFYFVLFGQFVVDEVKRVDFVLCCFRWLPVWPPLYVPFNLTRLFTIIRGLSRSLHPCSVENTTPHRGEQVSVSICGSSPSSNSADTCTHPFVRLTSSQY